MRLPRTDLLTYMILALGVAMATPGIAKGQVRVHQGPPGFGGRAVVADFVRLTGYGTGPILAAGPGLEVAAGRAGSHALGAAGCDSRGMTYRELRHPRVNLDVDSPGARRLDLIVRTVREVREVTFTLDGDPVGSTVLTGDWQRVSLRIQPLTPGAHRLSFTMSPTGARLSGESGSRVQALLHSVRLSTRIQTPPGDVVDTFTGDGVLWLEPGETLRVPAFGLAEHALQTDGLALRGDTTGLTITAAMETAEGAVDPLLSMPADLAVPWNLALDPKGARAPHFIRVSVHGEGEGVVGLKRPLLTRPRPASPPADPLSATPRLVLVVVPGLRSDDAAVALAGLEGVQVRHVWSTASAQAPALASLLTGQYAEGHGLVKRGAHVASNVTTLARAASHAGRATILRAGRVVNPKDKWLWTGYGDMKLATDGDFPHTAEHVLGATLEALQAAEGGPVLATAVLGDVAPPYLPRADAWTAHWPSGTQPPWDALNGRKELQQQRASGSPPSDIQRAYWRALRRGKVDEVIAALGPFVSAVSRLPGGPTRVVIAGLGGHDPRADRALPDLSSLVAPLAITGLGASGLPAGPADLTDVHATVLALAGLAPGDGPGHRLDIVEGDPWTDAAYANMAERWDVMVTPAVTLVGDRMTDGVTWFLPDAPPSIAVGEEPRSVAGGGPGTWTARGAVDGPATILDALLLRRFEARRGAAARWTRAAYGVAAAPGRAPGTGGLCGR